jgi:hypothetical protein
MSRRTRSREIEIFNFSFLDVLACTIGLLIFIMVMAFILQAGSPVADTSAVVRRREQQTTELEAAAQRDRVIAKSVEMELDRVVPTGDPQLVVERNTARSARDAAKSEGDRLTKDVAAAQAAVDQALQHESEQAQANLTDAHQQLASATSELDTATAAAKVNHVTFLPRKSDGSADDGGNDVSHIDCEADRLVIYHGETDGSLSVVGTVPASEVATPGSLFQKTLSSVSSDSGKRLLFWVRPDGLATFDDAKVLISSDIQYGFEPADADWNFQSTGKAGSQR